MEGPFELWKGQDIVEIPNVSDITFSVGVFLGLKPLKIDLMDLARIDGDSRSR